MSDRHRPPPILLLSTAGAAVSYVLFACSTGLANHTAALWLMVVSRLFAGICGGNITVAQAYIADITPPADRSKKMGLIGMAFGLGFIFGPFIGGESLRHLGDTGPGWVAAGLCARIFCWPGSFSPKVTGPIPPKPPRALILTSGRTRCASPRWACWSSCSFSATFCFSCFESTLPLLVGANFHLDFKRDATSASTIAYLLSIAASSARSCKAGPSGGSSRKWANPGSSPLASSSLPPALPGFPYLKGASNLSWKVLLQHDGLPWVWLLLALALLSVGTSLTRPPLFGMLSNLTPAHEQGATIGVAQGAGSLARILGPVFATALLPYSPPLPYLICAAVLLATTVLVVQRLGRKPQPAS